MRIELGRSSQAYVRGLLLNRRAAGGAAVRADVFVLIALGQDQQEPFARFDRDTASWACEQACFEPFERRSPVLHSREIITLPQADKTRANIVAKERC